MTHDESLTVYSDYVCPFCYLGKQSLEGYRERREESLAVEWHPFDLRSHKRGPDGEIDHSIADGKDEAYFEQVRENVARLREQYGADEMLNLDDLPENVDSFDAQVAALHVQREHPETWPAFDDAVFEALWVEGRDIGDADVLAEVAESVGLDGAEIRKAVADDELRTQLREAFEDAKAQGVTGVPTFAYGEHAARGAVPPEHLQRLVDGS
jgi:predicted DsbA family dithiol-disulfide isomerase